MTALHRLAEVRDLTGKTLWLRPFEAITQVLILDTQVLVGIDRAVSEQMRNTNWRVTKRGKSIYTFDLQLDGTWVMRPPFTVWWSVAEVHGQPAAPRDLEWEQICHRPGTDKHPLDNLARRAQGYKY